MEGTTEDRYMKVLIDSRVEEDDVAVANGVKAILDKHFDENNNVEVYKKCFNAIDLTSLNTTDTEQSIAAMVEKVNKMEEEYPELPNVAAICTYPNFAMTVSGALEVSGVDVAVVAGSFPSSQTFVEVKTAETALAVADGANEVDIVLNLGLFYSGNYEELADEISEIKHAARGARLKVILETGALKTAADIKKASILAMYSGADFIKTSTGKVYPGASLEAAYVMCQCIKEYHEKTGIMIGFKVSGGVSSTDDAVKYYTLVKEILGEQWLDNNHFRIGTSRAANYILSSIIGKEIKFFCVAAVFPLLVVLGASGNTTDIRSTKICNFLGDISYPIYITHYPIVYVYTAWVSRNDATMAEGAPYMLLVFVAAVALAYACLRLYDLPLRNWLTNRFLKKKIH